MGKEQLQVLNALDTAKTQWYHFTAIVIAGMGFFTDAYDLSASLSSQNSSAEFTTTSMVLPSPAHSRPTSSSAVNGVALCGTLAGQLFFGWLGDKLGRKKVYGMTLMLMVVCSIASGLSFGRDAKSVMTTLCFFRFWLGFGVGGDYPLSATIMSEYANKKTRGAFIAAVFAMQGFGILTGGIFAILVSSVFNNVYKAPPYMVDPVLSTPPQADYIWRIILMFGAIPAAMTFYSRAKMPETARFTALVLRMLLRLLPTCQKFYMWRLSRRRGKLSRLPNPLLTRLACFRKSFLDATDCICSVPLVPGLARYRVLQSELVSKGYISSIGWIPAAKSMNAVQEVFKIARAQTLIALCSTVPGYWFTVFLH
ncbi:unnamed protein product [Rhodiola kirilowii]